MLREILLVIAASSCFVSENKNSLVVLITNPISKGKSAGIIPGVLSMARPFESPCSYTSLPDDSFMGRLSKLNRPVIVPRCYCQEAI